jgi:hypothetical protein
MKIILKETARNHGTTRIRRLMKLTRIFAGYFESEVV